MFFVYNFSLRNLTFKAYLKKAALEDLSSVEKNKVKCAKVYQNT